jgi:uncharacterized protein (DUF1015 family)
VVLIQVGDVYFVRDGHHRISVARALGQEELEAEVTCWQVTGSLPWETAVHTGLHARMVGAQDKLRNVWARLVVYTRLNIHPLLGAVRMALHSPAAP